MPVDGADFADEDGNDPTKIDWSAYAKAGSFAYMRKSTCFRDPEHGGAYRLYQDQTFAQCAPAARADGVVVGSYMLPSCDVGAPSAAEQVANHKATPGDYIAERDLPTCVDVEFPGAGISATGRSQADVAAFLIQVIDEVQRQFGHWPLIYSSHVEMHDDNGLGGKLNLGGRPCPLWIKEPYPVGADQPEYTGEFRDPHYGGAPWDPADLWRVPDAWAGMGGGWWIRQRQGDARGYLGLRQSDVDDFSLLDLSDPATAGDRRLPWVAAKLGAAGQPLAQVASLLASFQAKRGLVADRKVGPRTFAALAAH
jgi:hypothetical protein